jgi:secreted PhoX family phosphatase
VAEVDGGGHVGWHPVPRPDPADTAADPTRLQVPVSTPFAGGEGIACARGHVFFTTKGDGRVWDYVPLTGTLSIVYDDDLDPGGQLSHVDNITVAPSFDLVVAEDKPSEQQLVLISPAGVASALVEMDQAGSEFAGPAFSPDGSRLYVSSQRGPGGAAGPGITYEIRGPFRHAQVDVGTCAAALVARR